jgi:hypothetical protein
MFLIVGLVLGEGRLPEPVPLGRVEPAEHGQGAGQPLRFGLGRDGLGGGGFGPLATARFQISLSLFSLSGSLIKRNRKGGRALRPQGGSALRPQGGSALRPLLGAPRAPRVGAPRAPIRRLSGRRTVGRGPRPLEGEGETDDQFAGPRVLADDQADLFRLAGQPHGVLAAAAVRLGDLGVRHGERAAFPAPALAMEPEQGRHEFPEPAPAAEPREHVGGLRPRDGLGEFREEAGERFHEPPPFPAAHVGGGSSMKAIRRNSRQSRGDSRRIRPNASSVARCRATDPAWTPRQAPISAFVRHTGPLLASEKETRPT